MLSPKTSIKVFRILPFGLLWLLFSLVYTLVERGLLGNLTQYPSTGNPYSFTGNLFITPFSAFITGLVIGTIEILYFNRLFYRMSFTRKIVFKSTIYLGIIVLFLFILSAISNASELKTGFFNSRTWFNAWAFFTNYAFLSVCVYMAVTIVVSQFYMEISDNIGQRVLLNFFTGRYHRPKEEERIFMFLDMQSSTTIAENLGHVRYFELLKAYYADISDPIINFSGEIYQYVGDEIVVSWTLKNGLDRNNCIECFFAIKETVSKQSQHYKKQFGLLPGFKAGFHIGKVTTGEIGVIKKEIIFTGDTLNTTARIQGLCNAYKADLLVSGDLIKMLDLHPGLQISTLGQNELRGRDEKIELFTISVAQ